MKYPEIRIKYGWLLHEEVSVHLHKLYAKNGQQIADKEWMKLKVADYQKAWNPYENKIIKGMCDTLELEFRQNIIDVYIAPWFSAISDPMVIGVIFEPDLFIDKLTHELLHRLLTDNTAIPRKTKLLPVWQKLFGSQHSIAATVHIPVYAIHKLIYLDILNEPERLKRNITNCKTNNLTEFVKAWDYVDKHDYKEIVEKLKANYAELKIK